MMVEVCNTPRNEMVPERKKTYPPGPTYFFLTNLRIEFPIVQNTNPTWRCRLNLIEVLRKSCYAHSC